MITQPQPLWKPAPGPFSDKTTLVFQPEGKTHIQLFLCRNYAGWNAVNCGVQLGGIEADDFEQDDKRARARHYGRTTHMT